VEAIIFNVYLVSRIQKEAFKKIANVRMAISRKIFHVLNVIQNAKIALIILIIALNVRGKYILKLFLKHKKKLK
jgi:hypothetical protein